MTSFLLNINHSVTLFRHCIGFVHACGADFKKFIFFCLDWYYGCNQSLSNFSIFLASVFKAAKPTSVLMF